MDETRFAAARKTLHRQRGVNTTDTRPLAKIDINSSTAAHGSEAREPAYLTQQTEGELRMPFCRREDDAALQIARKLDDEKIREPEWREPPGRLGEYVRRIKRQSALPQ